ncbi:MAG: hypothetical protein M3021_04175, partial [Actinomycetota bacterium]|nr:hypothetical protein [Actinomycetota bacterium]
MSQATDVLQKILQLEEHKGFQDSAVSGGLAAYAERWAAQARARQPAANGMIDAIRDILLPYSEQGRSSREVRLRRAVDLLARLAAGEGDAPADEAADPAAEADKKKRPRRAAPTISPLSMAVGARPERSSVQQPALNGASPTVGQSSALDGQPAETMQHATRNTQHATADLPQSADAARSAHRRLPSLDSPITVVKGVRENTAKLFERLTIGTIRDLLYFFPRRYDDFSALKPIGALVYGQIETVIGTIWRVQVKRTKNNLAMISATVVDDTGSMRAMWFGREWMARSLVEGQQFVFSGKVSEFNGQIGMNGPEFEPYDSEELLHTGRLVPVYPLTEGLTKRVVRRIVKAAADSFADLVEDALPPSIRARAQLLTLPDA